MNSAYPQYRLVPSAPFLAAQTNNTNISPTSSANGPPTFTNPGFPAGFPYHPQGPLVASPHFSLPSVNTHQLAAQHYLPSSTGSTPMMYTNAPMTIGGGVQIPSPQRISFRSLVSSDIPVSNMPPVYALPPNPLPNNQNTFTQTVLHWSLGQTAPIPSYQLGHASSSTPPYTPLGGAFRPLEAPSPTTSISSSLSNSHPPTTTSSNKSPPHKSKGPLSKSVEVPEASTTEAQSLNATFSEPRQCPHCDYKTNDPSKYQRHVQKHNKVFYCEPCCKQFSSNSYFKMHNEKFHGAPKHQCKICHSVFETRNLLKKHELIHLTEKRFKCPECNYACALKEVLKRHLRIHEKKRASPPSPTTFQHSQYHFDQKGGEREGEGDEGEEDKSESLSPSNMSDVDSDPAVESPANPSDSDSSHMLSIPSNAFPLTTSASDDSKGKRKPEEGGHNMMKLTKVNSKLYKYNSDLFGVMKKNPSNALKKDIVSPPEESSALYLRSVAPTYVPGIDVAGIPDSGEEKPTIITPNQQ